MRHTFWSIVALAAVILSMASCISDDNDTETSPECAIVSFSVGKITSYVTEKQYDSEGNAKDVVVTKTISGSDIHFNIDQNAGRIFTVDSLPKWVDLSKVVPSFSCYGNVYNLVNAEEDFYIYLTSGSDSIDFSKTVNLLCVASDGVSRKKYTVDIFKRHTDIDTLQWTSLQSNLRFSGEARFFVDGEKVTAFAKDGNGMDMCTVADANTVAEWSSPVSVPVESETVQMFGTMYYGKGEDGFIYRADDMSTGLWSKVSDITVERLLAADSYYLYAYDGHKIIGTTDMKSWTEQGKEDMDMLPDSYIHSVCSPTKHNANMEDVVMTGLSATNADNAVVWYKQSAKGGENQKWSYIQITADNSYGLPCLGQLSVTQYDGSLYAIGTEEGEYKHIYCSKDNGITWHTLSSSYPLPAGLKADGGRASIMTVGSRLWIVQENGKIWQGSIQ